MRGTFITLVEQGAPDKTYKRYKCTKSAIRSYLLRRISPGSSLLNGCQQDFITSAFIVAGASALARLKITTILLLSLSALLTKNGVYRYTHRGNPVYYYRYPKRRVTMSFGI